MDESKFNAMMETIRQQQDAFHSNKELIDRAAMNVDVSLDGLRHSSAVLRQAVLDLQYGVMDLAASHENMRYAITEMLKETRALTEELARLLL